MRKSLLMICLALLSLNGPLALGQDNKVSVSGKVMNQQNAPVAHAMVILTNKEDSTRQVSSTDKEGHFAIDHAATGTESLQIVPPAKSGLAQAFLQRVSGQEARHLLISLKKGFGISGRVVSAGKPVKGVAVIALPDDADTVHGGGQAVTDGKGRFFLILTPGAKTLEVSNDTPKHVAGIFRQKLSVTADAEIADLVIPRDMTASVEK